MSRLSPFVTRALGSRVVTAAVEAATAGRLRILAYHAVPDPAGMGPSGPTP